MGIILKEKASQSGQHMRQVRNEAALLSMCQWQELGRPNIILALAMVSQTCGVGHQGISTPKQPIVIQTDGNIQHPSLECS